MMQDAETRHQTVLPHQLVFFYCPCHLPVLQNLHQYAVIHYVADIKGHTAWAAPVRAAGVATFTCYCLPFIINPLIDILGIRLPDNIRFGCIGLVLAFVFAICVIFIAELLSKVRIRLKL